jgi:hypothetical protein
MAVMWARENARRKREADTAVSSSSSSSSSTVLGRGGGAGGGGAGGSNCESAVVRWVMLYYFPLQVAQLNPCVQEGLLSMWCCKENVFYRSVVVGDVMVVFASTKVTGKGNFGRVMFVCVWTSIVGVVQYLSNPAYMGRFDCTFDVSTVPWVRREGLEYGGLWHRGDENDKRQKVGSMNDHERDQLRTTVLLSTRYRDFHTAPVALPAHLVHLVHKTQSYAKHVNARPGDAAAVIAHFGL